MYLQYSKNFIKYYKTSNACASIEYYKTLDKQKKLMKAKCEKMCVNNN